MKCQWRPVLDAGGEHTKHMPGTCRVCWKPCYNEVTHGLHCDECYDMLALHPNTMVRMALAQEKDAPDSILELLASDLNPGVSDTARANLQRRERGETDTIEAWDFN